MCVRPFTPQYHTCLAELAQYTQTIATQSAPAVTWLYRGGCLQNLHDLRGAVRNYNQALERAGELTLAEVAQVYASRGVCKRQLDDKLGAVADGEQAILLDPKAKYYTDLGMARYWAGTLEAAIADFNQALALDGDESWSIAYRGLSYQGLGEHTAAIADLTQLIDLPVRVSYNLYLYRARSFTALDRFEEAIADCDIAAHRAAVEDFNIYQVRGYCYFRLGNLAAALGDFSRAVALNPDVHGFYLWRGLVYQALGDHYSATNDLADFVLLHPQGPAIAFHESAQALHLHPVQVGLETIVGVPALMN
jgi:tetratricopeptide (TPR) repeat protein